MFMMGVYDDYDQPAQARVPFSVVR